MRMTRILRPAWLLATTIATTAALAAPEPATAGARWDEAQAAFRAGHYAAAYGRFAALADAGHADAAEMALAMLRQGPALFGSSWTASAQQQRRWATLLQGELRRQAQWPLQHPAE